MTTQQAQHTPSQCAECYGTEITTGPDHRGAMTYTPIVELCPLHQAAEELLTALRVTWTNQHLGHAHRSDDHKEDCPTIACQVAARAIKQATGGRP